MNKYDCHEPPVRKVLVIHVVSTHTHRRLSRAKRAASDSGRTFDGSTGTRGKCARGPLCMTVIDGVPDKNSLSIICYEKVSQVFKKKELDIRSAVKSCQAGGSGEGESSRVALHETCMGVPVHTGTRIH